MTSKRDPEVFGFKVHYYPENQGKRPSGIKLVSVPSDFENQENDLDYFITRDNDLDYFITRDNDDEDDERFRELRLGLEGKTSEKEIAEEETEY